MGDSTQCKRHSRAVAACRDAGGRTAQEEDEESEGKGPKRRAGVDDHVDVYVDVITRTTVFTTDAGTAATPPTTRFAIAVQGEKNPVIVGGLYRREQLTAAAPSDSAVCTEQNDVVLGRTCG